MKKLMPAIVAGLVVATWWFVATREEPVVGDPSSAENARGSNSAMVLPVPEGVTLAPIAEHASSELNKEGGTISGDLDVLGSVMGFYHRLFNEHPVGLNHEIVEKLIGKNAKQVAMIMPGHSAINAKGELVDRWGTPFFFHQISGKEMEVISAGPDGRLWTADDVKREG